MDSNTAIKVLLSSTHLNSDTEALQHLTNTKTKDVQTNNLLVGTGANDLHLGGVLGFLLGGQANIVEHGSELGVVDLDFIVAVALAGLRLGEADAANLGVREDDCRNVLVGDLGVFQFGRAEEAAAELATGSNGNCGIESVYFFRRKMEIATYQGSAQLDRSHHRERKHPQLRCSGTHQPQRGRRHSA